MKKTTPKNTETTKRVLKNKNNKDDHQLNILYEDDARHHREAVMHNQAVVGKTDQTNGSHSETH